MTGVNLTLASQVTLSTREAFEAVNQMFGGALPLGGSGQTSVGQVAGASNAGFRAPDPRPPRASSQHPAVRQEEPEGGAGGGLFIREDTQARFGIDA